MRHFKENILEYNEEQRKILVDARQLFSVYEEALRIYQSYKGGMHWKTVKGRQYLFRTINSGGYGKCLGPRSKETEEIYEKFRAGKAEAKERLEAVKGRLAFQARLCKAVGLNRVPKVVAKLSELLYFNPSLKRKTLIVGTNALYAYESLAGVFLSGGVLATGDLDVLWDARSKVQVAGLPGDGFLGLLKKVDRSFEVSPNARYRAVNRDGFMVELIKPIPREHTWEEGQRTMSDFPGDLVAAEIKGLKWLVSCPKVVVVAIGADGLPAPMAVPDPRAFALHKLWMSEEKDRDPVKKERDRAQGELVLFLLREYLPNFPLEDDLLRALPQKVRRLAFPNV